MNQEHGSVPVNGSGDGARRRTEPPPPPAFFRTAEHDDVRLGCAPPVATEPVQVPMPNSESPSCVSPSCVSTCLLYTSDAADE